MASRPLPLSTINARNDVGATKFVELAPGVVLKRSVRLQSVPTVYVPVAVERARRLRGFEPGTVWVIGDTRHDLACARAGGARCLLVGTGRVPFEDLAALDADAALPDLSDVERVAALLLS